MFYKASLARSQNNTNVFFSIHQYHAYRTPHPLGFLCSFKHHKVFMLCSLSCMCFRGDSTHCSFAVSTVALFVLYTTPSVYRVEEERLDWDFFYGSSADLGYRVCVFERLLAALFRAWLEGACACNSVCRARKQKLFACFSSRHSALYSCGAVGWLSAWCNYCDSLPSRCVHIIWPHNTPDFLLILRF